MAKVLKTLENRGKFGYDVQLTFSNGDVLNCEDVDCDKDSVYRFMSRLEGEDIEEEQLSYLIHDHLVREYTVQR